MTAEKKAYAKPQLTVHGTLEELTQQSKYKTFGAGDDVILINSNQQLSNS